MNRSERKRESEEGEPLKRRGLTSAERGLEGDTITHRCQNLFHALHRLLDLPVWQRISPVGLRSCLVDGYFAETREVAGHRPSAKQLLNASHEW